MSRFRLGSVGECHQFASTDLVALHLGSYRTDGLPGGAQSVDLPVDDHDIFSGEVNEQVLQFVIRYAVAGATFFDNNAGLDYHFASNLAMVGGNVVLNRATAKRGSQAGGGFLFTTSWLEGQILVNNRSFAKDVGVRLSVDNGHTFHDTHGFFAGSNADNGIFVGPGAKVWQFETPELNLDNSASEVRFAVFYQDQATGEVFWDNNFGQDYQQSRRGDDRLRRENRPFTTIAPGAGYLLDRGEPTSPPMPVPMQLLDLPTWLRLSALQPRLPEPRLTVRRLTVMPSPRIRRQDCTKRVGSISQEREPTPMRSHQDFIKIS